MAIDPSKVKRFAHGSRVPGWDESADLTKDPAVVPDPASTPVPEAIRREIEGEMAKSYIADLIATLAMLDPILGGIDR